MEGPPCDKPLWRSPVAVRSYCGGATSRISGCSSKPVIGCLQHQEPSWVLRDRFFGVKSGKSWILRDQFKNIFTIFIYIIYIIMENIDLGSGTVRCTLVDSLRFLSHPAPFCFQTVRYTVMSSCQGFRQAVGGHFNFSLFP